MLTDELPQQGNWLFKRRSYVPLLLLPLALFAVATSRYYVGESRSLERWYEIVCLLVSLIGLIVRGAALGYAQAGTSGRNTEKQIADNLNTKGMYSVCRHPLYLGNILIAVGVMLFTKSLMFAVAGTLAYLLIYERIIAAEEEFLVARYGDVYRRWAATTPFLIPRFRQWVKPTLSFSLKTAIRGEFYGFTAVIVIMFLLNTLKRFVVEGTVLVDPFWVYVLAITLVMFAVLRVLRKYTKALDAGDRTENA